jgi:tRNA threonylcarbamoyladenosine biosynthesis protein TsaE
MEANIVELHDEEDMNINILNILTRNPEETICLGKTIGEALSKGDIVALIGELGSGKTCITRGIARGIGIPDDYRITSPTFTLINEYPGRIKLYHLDIYRLSGLIDIENMGYEDYFYGDGVVVIEWAEKIEEILSADSTLFIFLKYAGENIREIKITGSKKILLRISAELKGGNI